MQVYSSAVIAVVVTRESQERDSGQGNLRRSTEAEEVLDNDSRSVITFGTALSRLDDCRWQGGRERRRRVSITLKGRLRALGTICKYLVPGGESGH